MRAVFCHDGRYALREDGRVFSAAHFDSASWDRYLREFDRLDVVGRELPGRLEPHVSLVRSDAPGVAFHTFPNLNSPLSWIANRPTAVRGLRPLIEEADALILRGVTGLGSVAFRLARKRARPIALEMSGCPFDNSWNFGTWTGRLVSPFRYLIGRRTAASADFVLYVTREFLQRRYPTRGEQSHASNVRIERPDPSILEHRVKRIADHEGDYVLGLIGKVDHRLKGIHTVLEALASRRERLPGFRFRILGDGSPERWKTLAGRLGIADRVHFDGTLQPGPPVHAWLDGIDVYLQPSLHEGLPRATIEAMSRGCPVIASTTGGIPELVDRDWLHRPGDARRLGDLLANLLGSRPDQLRLARENFERAAGYAAGPIGERRRAFWQSFARFVRTRSGQAHDA